MYIILLVCLACLVQKILPLFDEEGVPYFELQESYIVIPC